MLFKAFIPQLLILAGSAQCSWYGAGQFGGYYPNQYGSFPGNFYGGGPSYYGGGPGFYGGGGWGYNPMFFAQNKDFDSSNFHKNQFDRNTNAAVFNDSIHKKDVDANHVNNDSNTKFFST